ncbi:FADL020Wp [Eremothecium gossypii FDAG1]|nr:FADL020Wp [Eremothecium gossypii FDAG1]
MRLGVMTRRNMSRHDQILWWVSLALSTFVVLGTDLSSNEHFGEWINLKDAGEMGCFAQLPSSFTKKKLDGQTSYTCFLECREVGTRYMALFNRDYCLCGNSRPDGAKSESCNLGCKQYPGENCGGPNAYFVYNIAPDKNGESSSALASSSTQGAASSSTTDPAGAGGKNPTTTNGERPDATPTTKAEGATTPTVAPSAAVTTTPAAAGGNTLTTEVIATTLRVTNSAGVYQTTVTAVASSTPSSDSAPEPEHKKKGPPTSTLVGAIVGSLVGLLFLIFLLIYFLRRMYARREQERMEKEYQEAIKPVDYEEAMYMTPTLPEGKELERSETTKLNPFDDTRRISTGSLIDSSPVTANHILTVVNPDQ